jgi:S-sulfo-L-cysteine synthase (O-acetyl-L-serine-dependent)
MGTTGTITGVSRYLKEQNPAVRIVGAQPSEGSRIPGIRKWPEAYLPKIYDPKACRRTGATSARPTPRTWRAAGARGGPVCRHLGRRRLLGRAADREEVENATIVFIVCDRGDRYLSTGVFPA